MYVMPQLGPIRPPPETYSLLIRATKNCPWNKCHFCAAFKEEKFQIRPVEEVKEDIRAAKKVMDDIMKWATQIGCADRVGDIARINGILWLQNDGVKSAFLQDSNSIIMKTEQLVEIIEYLYETFLTLERVSSYARAKTIIKKKSDELRQLKEAGFSRLYVGLETGDDELLAYVQKGATAFEMIQAGRKAIEAGFELSEYVMPGLGGCEKWEQHATNTARVLNEINPHFIRLRTLRLAEGTLLYEKARRGEFSVQTVEGVLIEIRRFIEELDVTSELITSDQSFNFFMGEVDGKLPEDKTKLLKSIDEALAWWRFKGEPKRNPFLGNLNQPAI
ncbi:MAG: radical SAM protein [Thermodesulfobacteriota bacterium]|nr:radical SAM protein [Thermodesulfobacteriota bacterium]